MDDSTRRGRDIQVLNRSFKTPFSRQVCVNLYFDHICTRLSVGDPGASQGRYYCLYFHDLNGTCYLHIKCLRPSQLCLITTQMVTFKNMSQIVRKQSQILVTLLHFQEIQLFHSSTRQSYFCHSSTNSIRQQSAMQLLLLNTRIKFTEGTESNFTVKVFAFDNDFACLLTHCHGFARQQSKVHLSQQLPVSGTLFLKMIRQATAIGFMFLLDALGF